MQSDNKKQSNLTYSSAQDYVKKTRALLKEEEQYEIDLFGEMTKNKSIAEIEALGYGLSNMLVTGSKWGYYGKTVLSLTKAYHSEKNPIVIPEQCKIQVGDDVALYKNNSIVADGVVSKRQGPKLQVTTRKELEDDNDLQGVNCNVVIKWNEVTYRRYFKVLEQMEKSLSPLLNSFFPPTLYGQSVGQLKGQYSNPKLNEKQNEAVERSIKEQIFLLHGPPGTGKTTTVCEAIVEAVKKGFKVLACGPSNISVDNIVQGISGRVNCIRIGNPARIIESVLERCLDSQIAANSGNWKNEVKKLQSTRKKLSRGGTKEERRQLHGQIKQLKDEIYRLQEQVIEEILQDAQVLCCTNVGAADRVFNRYLSKTTFDLVVIDECGQALEVSCWIPLLKGRRVLLAGDHKQLPPTIQGNDHSLLSHTLFTRSMEELQHIPSIMLEVQYRMNNAIMGWSNQQFYHGRLRAHNSVKEHTLKQLCAGVKPDEESLLFIDTAGCGMGEDGGQNESKMNLGEADLVISIYKKLLNYGVSSKYIAILTPYSKQVATIKSLVGEKNLPLVDVSTVDGIQGREKECIIISMVRSNTKRQIGFLKDWRRMNVAVTRARRMLVLVGNVECVTADKYIQALVKWIEEHGHVTSAEEWRDDEEVRFGMGASDKIEQYKQAQNEKGEKVEEGQNKQKKKKKKDKNKEEQPRQHTEEEQAGIKAHFRAVFEKMARELTINNATAFERKMIHEVAQEMGICHETSQDKKYIKVWRKMTNDEVSQRYAQLERIKYEEDLAEQKKKEKLRKKKEKKQQKKGQQRATSNKFADQLKQLQGQSSSQESIEEAKEEHPQNEQKEAKVESKPKKGKKNKNKKEAEAEEEEDIQALMKQFSADQPKENECFKCNKKITSVTRVECKFCRIFFCRVHVLAEEHGCGEIAKEEARRVKPTERQLELAASKLQEKIKKQEQGRKKKGKEDKGKK